MMRPYRGRFGREEAAHLLRRAAFAPAPGEVEAAVETGLEATVSRLLAAELPEGHEEADALDRSLRDSDDTDALAGAWLLRLGTSGRPLRETLVLFLHNHFVSALGKVGSGRMMLDQIALFRRHALGGFGRLAREVSRDPAMVRYLDLERSKLSQPNENFARELMELFTTGPGPYTERDIQDAARAFTGYLLRNERFRFSRASHDSGTKTVLGHTGRLDGDAVIELCVAHPATSRHLGRKLARMFIADDPPDAAVRELAATWRAEGGQVRRVLEKLLTSDAFFDPKQRFRVTRGPAALVAAVMRSLRLRPRLRDLARATRIMGQTLFDPPTVKGYEGGSAWINPASWLARRAFLLDAGRQATEKGALEMISRATDLELLAAEVIRHLLDTPPAKELTRSIAALLSGHGADRRRHLLGFLLCHPLFQKS